MLGNVRLDSGYLRHVLLEHGLLACQCAGNKMMTRTTTSQTTRWVVDPMQC